MLQELSINLVRARYHEVHGAQITPCFDNFLGKHTPRGAAAAMGYRRAEHGRLFLEAYLANPIEQVVSNAFGQTVRRADIVELGNFAASNGRAMIELWGRAANDLGSTSLVAVATLTRPLRAMFARIGLPIVELAPAHAEAVGNAASEWGSYYEQEPVVCAGWICEGQRALAGYFMRHDTEIAA